MNHLDADNPHATTWFNQPIPASPSETEVDSHSAMRDQERFLKLLRTLLSGSKISQHS